ncbi:pyridoxal phosphate-dependent transferase [Podospora fimiseda]|uniref:Pyridoxal phosphate-dependent transferase n=1 Tax=Podospora fimiseda TaxID=252190 RepID=A0AAN7GZF9_9PEZI|nr:pyridoxal phosphate-dependent transferase [Podospora fimiseda]
MTSPTPNSPSEPLTSALQAALTRFTLQNPNSHTQHILALSCLPGGNTRTILHTNPFPITISSSLSNNTLLDLDNHTYLDLTADLSAGLYGHSNPIIHQSIISTLSETGLSLGSTTIHEQKFAELLCKRFVLERVRMCNSGTEANLYALAAARRFTGRRKIVVFAGGYHGGVLSFGDAEKWKEGNVVDKDEFVLVERYNDLEEAKRVISEVGGRGELAGVLVEAMQGAGGCIVGSKEFLEGIQDCVKRFGGLFILDEVMTSRLAPAGLAGEFGLKPDLVTLGKYLGGGLAFGCFGGREEVMRVYDPREEKSLGHSGTFNNNSLVMRVGYEALKRVYTEEVCRGFNELGEKLRERLEEVGKGTRMSVRGMGSLMALGFGEEGTDLRDLFWFEMVEEGYWITRRGMIALILGTTDEELEGFVEAVGRFVEIYRGIMAV